MQPVEVVDHRIPFNGPDDPLRLDPSNLQSLCRRHHGLKTHRDLRGG
ncbi:MAG: HNH endonuclease [Planctomycetaceae bacterium]|nr:HNH endonuclease [Planctomycetaceae bacterium]